MTTGAEHRQDGVLVRAWFLRSGWRTTNEYIMESRRDDGSRVGKSVPMFWDPLKCKYKRAEGPENRWVVLEEWC